MSSMLRAKTWYALAYSSNCWRTPLSPSPSLSSLAPPWKSLWKSWQQSSERHFSLIVMASPSKENPPTKEGVRYEDSSTKVGSKGRSRAYGTQQKLSNKEEDRIYYLGRLLTAILRHRAEEFHLKLRPDGYVAVRDLLKLGAKTMAGIPLSVYTVDDVIKAVGQDNKQRFGLLMENDVLLIRANQGHSIKAVETEQLLRPIFSADEVPVCVHGTSMNNLDSILRTGLQKMRRNHVHFATGLPNEDGVISGMRSRSDALIYLDAKKALEDGMKLFMSDNGVVLTEGFGGVIPPKYFAQVAKWKKGKIIPIDLSSKKEFL